MTEIKLPNGRTAPIPLKLDIGAGAPGFQREPLNEWVRLGIHPDTNIDIVSDFGSIPLPSGSVDEIFIGDIIEHIPIWRRDEVLTEWNRVLKIDGVVNGKCPNIDRAMKDYTNGTLSLHDAMLSLYGWADRPTELHYTGYTKETLTDITAKYGFDITDFSGSPGPADRPWWLVFSGKKVRNL